MRVNILSKVVFRKEIQSVTGKLRESRRFFPQPVNGFVDGFQCDMLVVDYLGIGGTTLAWSAVARMIGTRRDDKIDWKSEAMSLKRLSHLRFPATQYESFIEAAKRETGCTSSSIRSFRDGSVGLI